MCAVCIIMVSHDHNKISVPNKQHHITILLFRVSGVVDTHSEFWFSFSFACRRMGNEPEHNLIVIAQFWRSENLQQIRTPNEQIFIYIVTKCDIGKSRTCGWCYVLGVLASYLNDNWHYNWISAQRTSWLQRHHFFRANGTFMLPGFRIHEYPDWIQTWHGFVKGPRGEWKRHHWNDLSLEQMKMKNVNIWNLKWWWLMNVDKSAVWETSNYFNLNSSSV